MCRTRLATSGPICTFRVRIEQPQVRNEVLLIIGRQGVGVWRHVCHRRIERLSHEMSYKRRSSAGPLSGDKAPSTISDTCPPNRSNILPAVFDRMITPQGNSTVVLTCQVLEKREPERGWPIRQQHRCKMRSRRIVEDTPW